MPARTRNQKRIEDARATAGSAAHSAPSVHAPSPHAPTDVRPIAADQPPIPPVRESPPWECEDGPLPKDDEELQHAQDGGQDGTDSSTDSSSLTSSSKSSSDEDDEPAQRPAAFRRRGRAASGVWTAQADLYLSRALLQHQPLSAPHGKKTPAWKAVKADLEQVGVHRGIEALKERADKLVSDQKKSDAAALRKSGAAGDIDELQENMAQVVQLMEDAADLRALTSKRAKKRTKKELKAGAQMREAAMHGAVERRRLVDLGELPGATPRERMGQRKRARSPSASGDGDKENARPKKRTRETQELVAALEVMNQRDEQRLEEATRQFTDMTSALKSLAESVASQQAQTAAVQGQRAAFDSMTNMIRTVRGEN